MPIALIDFDAAAARLIAEWADMDEDEREHAPSFGGLGPGELPFTVYDDFSVTIGHHTDGIYASGSADDCRALAAVMTDCAAMLDFDPAEMTTPIKIR